jgi:stage IV sporulation protein FB
MVFRRSQPDVDPFDRPPSFGERVRRAFGENPLTWALPLYRLGGITVKVHVFFVLYIVLELIFANTRSDAIGMGYTALFLGTLFVLVLLHEYGHCLACRFVGGEADEILMWPLGGLASCRPPHHWKASLVTTLGGPVVNVVLWPILGLAVLAMGTGWGGVLFNPLFPNRALASLGLDSWWKVAVWQAYYVNFMLLAFNMLCVMFPLDAGRVVQELLWGRLGYRRSMEIATTAGLGMAGALAILGMVGQQTTLLSIAIFGGVVCYGEKQRLKWSPDPREDESPFAESLRGGMGGGFAGGFGGGFRERDEERAEEAERKAEAKRRAEEARHQAEVDRILAKIKASGMGSLTSAERKTLESDTQRKRGR